MHTSKQKIYAQVRKKYAEIATEGCFKNSCCSLKTSEASDNSGKLGYSRMEIESVPDGANMGLGCGNPQAIAGLKEGETVLDLGSGAGFDCFLASSRVGKTGHVIGVDMTPEMLAKARLNAEKGKYDNVEFRLGEIEHLPVADNSVDVVISNCVINLSPDKSRVFREVFRVLKKGGILTFSDIVAEKPLPEALKKNPDAYCGCIGGAVSVAEIEKMLTETGFDEIKIKLNENSKLFIRDWFPDSVAEDYVISAVIKARKKSCKKNDTLL